MTTPTTEAAQQARKTAILNAICRGIQDSEDFTYGKHQPTDERADNVYAAIRDELNNTITNLIETATSTTEFGQQVLKALLPDFLNELIDQFGEIHDDPKTPDGQRPGLRRANRHLRQLRNELKDTQ